MTVLGHRLLFVLLCLGLCAGAEAQTVRLDAQVTGVAGAEVYLDRGAAAGLSPGDTMAVERAGERAGDLEILVATASASVATFAGPPFAITRGEPIVLVLRSAAPVPAPPPEPPPDSARAASEARASLFTTSRSTARATRSGPSLSGRLQSGVFALWSTTRPEVGEAVGRTYASPTVSLRAEVADLPAGARLRLDGRTTYRYSDVPGSSSVTDVQIREAALEVGSRTVRLDAGRFVPDYERMSGYWDGASLRVGTDRAGVGAAAGFQPDRTNGLPSFDLPKAAAYAYASHQQGGVRADGSLSAGHLFSDRGASFAGASGTASYRVGSTALRASGSLLGDGDGRSGWGVSRASLRGSARAGRVDASASYGRYRPSALTTAQLPAGVLLVASVRETVSGRLGVRLGTRGPEVYASGGAYRRDGVADGTSVGGGLRVSRLSAPLPVGVSLDVSTRQSTGLSARFASARATTRLGPASVALGVRLSQSTFQTTTLTTTGVEGSVSAPLSRKVGVSLQGGVYGGSGLGRTSLYTSVWTRL